MNATTLYRTLPLAAGIATLLGASSAHAYVGPGMGAGIIASILGVLGSIVLLVFSILYYPIKRALRRRRSSHDASSDANNVEASASAVQPEELPSRRSA